MLQTDPTLRRDAMTSFVNPNRLFVKGNLCLRYMGSTLVAVARRAPTDPEMPFRVGKGPQTHPKMMSVVTPAKGGAMVSPEHNGFPRAREWLNSRDVPRSSQTDSCLRQARESNLEADTV